MFAKEEALGKGITFLSDAMRISVHDQEGAEYGSHKILRAIFEGFKSRSLTALCNDNDSRRLAFVIIFAATEACRHGDGFNFLTRRI